MLQSSRKRVVSIDKHLTVNFMVISVNMHGQQVLTKLCANSIVMGQHEWWAKRIV
jgi:hypothetical protein